MSEELLREAVAGLRDSSPTGTWSDPCGECGVTGAFLDAVANLLEDVALDTDHFDLPVGMHQVGPRALAIARAVLGSDT